MADPVPGTGPQISVVHARAVVRLKAWYTASSSPRSSIEINDRTLPDGVGTTASGEPRLLCLGPGDWLAVSDVVGSSTLSRHLEQVARAHAIATLDISHGVACLRVAGPRSCEVLSKGCGLDLHPRAFPVNYCARTRLAMVAVTLDHRAEGAVDVYVERSYLAFLQSWLRDASGLQKVS